MSDLDKSGKVENSRDGEKSGTAWGRTIAICVGLVTVAACVVLVVVLLLVFIGARALPSKPDMPISIGYRNSAIGQGNVVVLKNESAKHLRVLLTLRNPTMRDQKLYYIDIAPNGKKEIGWAEGWKAFSGDEITVAHDDYRTKTMRIP